MKEPQTVMAYRALVQHGPLTSAMLAEILGITTNGACGVLWRLKDAGGCESLEDRLPSPANKKSHSQVWRAISPWTRPAQKTHPGNTPRRGAVTRDDLAWMQAQRDCQAARRAHRARV